MKLQKVLLYALVTGVVGYALYKYLCPTIPLKLRSTDNNVLTVVMLRHGEKPALGLGNLTCQGLNRAVALPSVLFQKFGKPHYIFAPNPNGKIYEGGSSFDYIRPLVTIAPTAIKNELSVNTTYAYDEYENLNNKLKNAAYANATVFIAWEHTKLAELAKLLMKTYKGSPNKIPEWRDDDYDTLFVFKIERPLNSPIGRITFTVDSEGLNGMGSEC